MKHYFIILLAFIYSCGNKQESENPQGAAVNENTVQLTDAQLKNAGIETAKPEQKNISTILKVSGAIDVPPQNMVSISVPLGGYLKSSNLLPGMRVRKGQSLAVMEDQQYIQLQQDYLTAKAKLVFSEAEYNRQKDLNQSKAVSDKVFQQAEANFKSDKVAVKSLSEKLKLIGINPEALDENTLSRSINIFSPIDGFVSKVNVNIGKYANASDVLFEIVNPTDIHLALNVYEKDIDKLHIGQKLTAYTNSNPEKKYTCEIILIGQDLTHDRSVEVHCHFEQYDSTLIPGMYMNAEIELQNNSASTLPEDAVVSYEGKQYVFATKSATEFEMVEVKTGITENGFTEIIWSKPDTQANAVYVTKGAYNLLMALKNTGEE
jgi:cobalt-zinc-cadmium efflux system membrane fusion protein